MRIGGNTHGGLCGPGDSLPRRVPGYVLEAELGRGASGEVWRARVAATGAAVAIKWVPLTGPEQARAARAEAAMLQTLDHPHLVRLHDVVPVPDALALVLDLAEGGSLAELVVARGAIAAGEAVAAMSGVGAALAVAHAAGVVHGDVTPANVLFTEIALPLLADLGVARIVGERRPARTTPAFVDPLVAIGGVPGPSSDVFMAAGTTLFALTGRPLWPGETAEQALAYAAAGRLDPEARLADPRVPPAVARVLRVALDLDPARRGTAADFALELRHAAEPCAIELAAGRARGGIGAPAGGRTPEADDPPTSRGPRHRAPVDRASGRQATPRRGARSVSAPGATLRWRGLVAATARGRGVPPARGAGSAPPPVTRGASMSADPAAHRPRHAAVTAPPVSPPSGVRSSPAWALAGPPTDARARPCFARPVMSPADGVGEAAGATLAGHGTSTRSYAAPRSPAWPADRSIGVGPSAGSALTHGVRARPVALRPARPSRRQRAVRTVGLAAAVAGVSVGAAVAIRAWQAGGRPGSTAAAPVLPASPAGSRPTARPPSVVESAGVTLRQLAATRARAFATRNPVLLGGVYLPGPLLTADQALLTRLVPPGCGLVGADTTYGVLSATGDAERRVVVATATVAASRLVCAGQLRGQAAASPATVMRIELRSSNSRAWRITALQVA